jgi:hypothetical protein
MGERLQRPYDGSGFSGGFCLTHTDTEVSVKGEILEEVRKEVKQVEMGEDQVVAHMAGRPSSVGGGPTGHVRRCVLYESASTVWPFSRAAEGWGVECWPTSGEGARQMDERLDDGGEPRVDEEVVFVGVPSRGAVRGRRSEQGMCGVMMEQAIELRAATVILVLDPETVRGDAGFGAGQGTGSNSGQAGRGEQLSWNCGVK